MRPALLLGALLLSGAQVLAQSIDRVEPPSWWVGMHNPKLELMLHGPGLARLQPKLLPYAGVQLRGSRRGDSPNYLFVELEIAPQTKPGQLQLELLRDSQVVARQDYALQARAPGSAQRQGFDSRDAIYLVVPDRFANGDPGNDDVAGLGDPVLRSDPNRRHGGDLRGLDRHLDYIAAMGFTQVWPTPLLENKQPQYSYHGYSQTDLYKIDPRFGSNEDYRRLVQRARSLGLGFIQDIVPNHIGSGHWWMQDLPSKDWVNQLPVPESAYVETNHRHVTQLDPYVAPSERTQFTDGWFVRSMPDLNQRNPQLARYLTQNAIWWIEYAGLSGLRVDTYPYSDKAFLAHWSAAIMAEYPRLSLVGEEMSNNPLLVSYWLRGPAKPDGYRSAMPSMMDFPLHYVLRDALIEPDGLSKLYEAMVNDLLYPEPRRLVMFEGNHDTNRIYSALGEDAALTRLALAFIATSPRTPQLFYGSEILMRSPIQREDGQVRADFPGGWAGDAVDAFSATGLSAEQAATQAWLRQLLNWRKHSPAVQQGRLMHYLPQDDAYVYFRYTDSAKVMVVLNRGKQALQLDTRRFAEMLGPNSVGSDVISGQQVALGRSLSVPARTALVLDVRD